MYRLSAGDSTGIRRYEGSGISEICGRTEKTGFTYPQCRYQAGDGSDKTA